MKVVKRIRLEDLALEIQMIPQNLQESVDQVLELPRMIELARAFCPVLTGALRDTIRVERVSPFSAKLVAGDDLVDYAPHVHEGTVNMPARPFLLQAVLAEKPNVSKDILIGAVDRL